MSAEINDYRHHPYGIGSSLDASGSWHAVAVGAAGATHRSPTRAAWPSGGGSVRAEAFSVCGAPVRIMDALGPYGYDHPLPPSMRCERCSWVAAIDRGTVEREIDLHVAAAGPGTGRLLRRIFTAILADAAPGPAAAAGHRTDLLAHAARHRPVTSHWRSGHHDVDDHGRPGGSGAPLCLACSFTTGGWAGEGRGAVTGECDVVAPCSVLTALAHHYGIDPDGGGDVGSE